MSTEASLKPLSRRTFAALAAALVVSPVTPAFAASKSLRGTVSYRERIALPPNAILEVRLQDTSLADAPAKTIAVTRVKTRGRTPIPYRLWFDGKRIKPRRTYTLSARITVNGQLWFITTTQHRVFDNGPDETEIQVERVKSDPSGADHPGGRWLAEDIRGHGVIDNLQSVIDLGRDGRISGSGGCNRINGKAEIKGNRISIGPIASTRMACAPAIMDQEAKFIRALEDAKRWRIDDARGKLILFDGNNRPILVLARM